MDDEPGDERVSANVDHRTDDHYDQLESKYQQVVSSLLHVHGKPCLQREFLQEVQTLWLGVTHAVLKDGTGKIIPGVNTNFWGRTG